MCGTDFRRATFCRQRTQSGLDVPGGKCTLEPNCSNHHHFITIKGFFSEKQFCGICQLSARTISADLVLSGAEVTVLGQQQSSRRVGEGKTREDTTCEGYHEMCVRIRVERRIFFWNQVFFYTCWTLSPVGSEGEVLCSREEKPS